MLVENTRFAQVPKPATSFTAASIVPHMHFRDVLFIATISFALGGSESASFLGDKVYDARQNLPRALLAGGVFVTIGYMVGTIAVLVRLPEGEVNGLGGIMQAVSIRGTRRFRSDRCRLAA